MAINHQISSNAYDGYHGAVKAKELHSQGQREHGNMRAVSGKEGSRLEPQVHSKIDKNAQSRSFDNYDFAGHNSHRQDVGHFSHEQLKNNQTSMYGAFQGTTRIHQFTQTVISDSAVFSGAHFGSLEKNNEAHSNLLNAVSNFIKNPSEQAYKSLNDAMIKLMDPKFTSAAVGGEAQVTISNVKGGSVVKVTMEVTPAPTKTLEEAREDLKNAYSSRRDGEKDISSIRAEAYTNYIRALSEKLKKDGVISHTNNTPTTPVSKSSVIYIVKTTHANVPRMHEIKKPTFGHNPHSKLTFKNQHDSWNNYRQNHKSYVDMLKHDSNKSRIDKDHKAGKAVEAKHGRDHSGRKKAEKSGHGVPKGVGKR